MTAQKLRARVQAGASPRGSVSTTSRDRDGDGDTVSVGNDTVRSGSVGGGNDTRRSGSTAAAAGRMPKKRIGGKLKVAYAPPIASPVAKPFTDDDEARVLATIPEKVTTVEALASVKSPQNPRRKTPKVKNEY
jgi:hypothetical protein